MAKQDSTFEHPFDTPLSSALRFLVEVLAWVAGPRAAAQFSPWLIAPALAVLVGLPAVFSTVGDKRQVIVATPGPPRLAIELGLHAVAAVAPWLVWPPWAAAAAGAIVLVALLRGLPRARWLLAGAPAVGS